MAATDLWVECHNTVPKQFRLSDVRSDLVRVTQTPATPNLLTYNVYTSNFTNHQQTVLYANQTYPLVPFDLLDFPSVVAAAQSTLRYETFGNALPVLRLTGPYWDHVRTFDLTGSNTTIWFSSLSNEGLWWNTRTASVVSKASLVDLQAYPPVVRYTPFSPMNVAPIVTNIALEYSNAPFLSPYTSMAVDHHWAPLPSTLALPIANLTASPSLVDVRSNLQSLARFSPSLTARLASWEPLLYQRVSPSNAALTVALTVQTPKQETLWTGTLAVRPYAALASNVSSNAFVTRGLVLRRAQSTPLVAAFSQLPALADPTFMYFALETPPTHGVLVAGDGITPTPMFTYDDLVRSNVLYQHVGDDCPTDVFKLRWGMNPYGMSPSNTLSVTVQCKAWPIFTSLTPQNVYFQTSNDVVSSRIALDPGCFMASNATYYVVATSNLRVTDAQGTSIASFQATSNAYVEFEPTLPWTLDVVASPDTLPTLYTDTTLRAIYGAAYERRQTFGLNRLQQSNLLLRMPTYAQTAGLDYTFLTHKLQTYFKPGTSLFQQKVDIRPDFHVSTAGVPASILERINTYAFAVEWRCHESNAAPLLMRADITDQSIAFSNYYPVSRAGLGPLTTPIIAVVSTPPKLASATDTSLAFVNLDDKNSECLSMYWSYNPNDSESGFRSKNLLWGASVPSVWVQELRSVRVCMNPSDVRNYQAAYNDVAATVGNVLPVSYEIVNRATTLYMHNHEIAFSTVAAVDKMDAYNVAFGKRIVIRGLNNLAFGSDFVTSGVNSIILGNNIGNPYTSNSDMGVFDDINNSIVVGQKCFQNSQCRDIIAIGRNILNDAETLTSKNVIQAFYDRRPILIGNDMGISAMDFDVNIGNAFLRSSNAANTPYEKKIFLGQDLEIVGLGFTSNVSLSTTYQLHVNGGGILTPYIRTNDIYLTCNAVWPSRIYIDTQYGGNNELLCSTPTGLEWKTLSAVVTGLTTGSAVYTGVGATTFTLPLAANTLSIDLWGAGGGGASGAYVYYSSALFGAGGGGGGGGGAYGRIVLSRTFVGSTTTTFNYTIGGGGIGGITGSTVANDGLDGTDGTDGGATSVSWVNAGTTYTVVARGGKGGKKGLRSFAANASGSSTPEATYTSTGIVSATLSFLTNGVSWTTSSVVGNASGGVGGISHRVCQLAYNGTNGGDTNLAGGDQVYGMQPTGGGGGGGVFIKVPFATGNAVVDGTQGFDGGAGGGLDILTSLTTQRATAGHGSPTDSVAAQAGATGVSATVSNGPGAGGAGGGGSHMGVGGKGGSGGLGGGGGAGGGGGRTSGGAGGDGGGGRIAFYWN